MNWLRLMSVAAVLTAGTAAAQEKFAHVVLGVHGGAGGAESELTAADKAALKAGLKEALEAGYKRLQQPGATSLDAVETAIRLMEDNPRFNAGKGAVFTEDGRNELDASIMVGDTMKAGAVAGVTTIKNPISAARAVMEKSKHVMLVGKGAEQFAASPEVKLEIVDPAYFKTEARWKEFEADKKAREEAAKSGKQTAVAPAKTSHLGTVGAVAIDGRGVLAAGTSTGGMSNKRFGRVGDSPVIGAGTYAENGACAVSCTGHGEYFIRYAAAHTIVSLMKYKNYGVQQATDEVINGTLKKAGGSGAAIALDHQGNFTYAHNTEGVYRGCITADGKVYVALYKD